MISSPKSGADCESTLVNESASSLERQTKRDGKIDEMEEGEITDEGENEADDEITKPISPNLEVEECVRSSHQKNNKSSSRKGRRTKKYERNVERSEKRNKHQHESKSWARRNDYLEDHYSGLFDKNDKQLFSDNVQNNKGVRAIAAYVQKGNVWKSKERDLDSRNIFHGDLTNGQINWNESETLIPQKFEQSGIPSNFSQSRRVVSQSVFRGNKEVCPTITPGDNFGNIPNLITDSTGENKLHEADCRWDNPNKCNSGINTHKNISTTKISNIFNSSTIKQGEADVNSKRPLLSDRRRWDNPERPKVMHTGASNNTVSNIERKRRWDNPTNPTKQKTQMAGKSEIISVKNKILIGNKNVKSTFTTQYPNDAIEVCTENPSDCYKDTPIKLCDIGSFHVQSSEIHNTRPNMMTNANQSNNNFQLYSSPETNASLVRETETDNNNLQKNFNISEVVFSNVPQSLTENLASKDRESFFNKNKKQRSKSRGKQAQRQPLVRWDHSRPTVSNESRTLDRAAQHFNVMKKKFIIEERLKKMSLLGTPPQTQQCTDWMMKRNMVKPAVPELMNLDVCRSWTPPISVNLMTGPSCFCRPSNDSSSFFGYNRRFMPDHGHTGPYPIPGEGTHLSRSQMPPSTPAVTSPSYPHATSIYQQSMQLSGHHHVKSDNYSESNNDSTWYQTAENEEFTKKDFKSDSGHFEKIAQFILTAKHSSELNADNKLSELLQLNDVPTHNKKDFTTDNGPENDAPITKFDQKVENVTDQRAKSQLRASTVLKSSQPLPDLDNRLPYQSIRFNSVTNNKTPISTYGAPCPTGYHSTSPEYNGLSVIQHLLNLPSKVTPYGKPVVLQETSTKMMNKTEIKAKEIPDLDSVAWRLTPIDVAIKVPYPLMQLPQDVPHLLNDPRFRGQIPVVNCNHQLVNKRDPRSNQVKVEALSYSSPSSDSPSLNTQSMEDLLFNEISDTNIKLETSEMCTKDKMVSPERVQSDKISLNEMASVFDDDMTGIPKLVDNITDRSYLIDPRFRRRKLTLSTSADDIPTKSFHSSSTMKPSFSTM